MYLNFIKKQHSVINKQLGLYNISISFRGFNVIFCPHNVVYFDVYNIFQKRYSFASKKCWGFFSSLYFILFTVKLIDVDVCCDKIFQSMLNEGFPPQKTISIVICWLREISVCEMLIKDNWWKSCVHLYSCLKPRMMNVISTFQNAISKIGNFVVIFLSNR